MIPVINFVGRSGAGKTTYLEKLIAEMKRRAYKIGVIKHDAHEFDIDHPGKDTWRHAQAGADVVCISSHNKFALIEKQDRDRTLDEMVARIAGVDFIFVEGYKDQGRYKIEIHRTDAYTDRMYTAKDLFASVSDTILSEELPHFPVNDPSPLADFLIQHFMAHPK
jgi:molybdopterin-guanine dinucleotide biosynthesis adapter protein